MEHRLKRFLDIFLIVIAFFNGLFLIFFVAYLLIGWRILSYRFFFLVKPIDILSKNFLLAILLFVLQLLPLCYCFFKFKKRVNLNPSQNEGDVFDSSNSFELFDDQLILENNETREINFSSPEIEENLVIAEEIDDENKLTRLTPPGEFSSLPLQTKEQKKKDLGLSVANNSPLFHLSFHQEGFNSIRGKIDRPAAASLLLPKKRDPRLTLNDSQFAFYQRLLKEKWIYENSQDRSRIQLAHYAIDEANLPLSEINILIKKKMLYRKIIPHPSGSFVIYSTKKGIEKNIIYEIIEKMVRNKRHKLIDRKIEFPNWKDLDLMKKTWSFDFEIALIQIIGTIWIKNLFRKSEIRGLGYTFTDKKREELKALIATILMKFNRKGEILLITNYEKKAQKIINLCKEISQVKISVLFLSDQHFENRLYALLASN